MQELDMQELLDAGIIDLGGTGNLLLEIEYNNGQDEFKEAVYRLPETCNEQNIVRAVICHLQKHSIVILEFKKTFNIHLPDRCTKLVEVRLPDAIGGDNITELFTPRIG